MGKLIKWFSENHVTANLLMFLVVVAGFTSWYGLKKEVFPSTALDAVIVQVPYPNATAEEVESGIVLKLEEAIADNVEGVKRYTSTSREGMAALTVEVESGYDVREVMDDVKTAVDAIREFPENAESPMILEAVISHQVLSIAISAETDEMTLREIAETVRNGLLNYKSPAPDNFNDWMSWKISGEPKITKVKVVGARPFEINIEVTQLQLDKYGLTLSQVAEALKQSSLDLPSGSVREVTGEIVIRTDGKIEDAETFRNVVIVTRADGSAVRLRDVATVIDGFEQKDVRTRFDGRRALVVNVYRTGEQNTPKIAAAVQDYVQRVAPSELPQGVQLELWNDMNVLLQGRMDLLGRNGAWGLLFVFVVLAIFLRPSLAFLVSIGIPVSFAGGLWMMPHLGVSINMISLFAFILVLGIVVDDAIVVGENIYTRIRRGEDPKQAAWKGTHEVGVVVIFGVFTTMAAFTPMLGLSGVSGKIWPNIPLVVLPVLLFSLLQSKLVLPAHAALLRPHNTSKHPGVITRFQRRVADGMEWVIEHWYKPVLSFCLRMRYPVWATFMAMLMVVVALVASGKVPFVFMPKVEGEVVTAKLEMPVGVEFGITDSAISRIEKAALAVGKQMKDHHGDSVIVHLLGSSGSQPFVTGFSVNTSAASSHLGEVTVQLCPASERQWSTAQVVNAWRDEIGKIPGAVELSFKEQTGSGGNAIDIEIAGNDLAELEKAAHFLTTELAKMEGVKDISIDRRPGKQEIVYDQNSLTPFGRSKGFTLRNVSAQIRAAFAGVEVQRIQRGRDEVKVLVRYPEEDRKSILSLDDIKLTAPNGDKIPIKQVIQGSPRRGEVSIKRVDGRRAIKISADVNREIANAKAISETFTKKYLSQLETKFDGVSWDFLGEQKDQNDSISEMSSKFIFALLLIYMLMAVPLKSYIQPLIVMSVIPFGIVGAVMGHIFMGMDLSIMSLCGIVALAGVVVNDSLVLVDYVNRKRALGMSVLDSAWTAGARRFRPIMLTSLTTFAGLMPMLTETDMQAKFLIPMAVSLGFGILFATAITLILVPSLYLILEDIKKLVVKCCLKS